VVLDGEAGKQLARHQAAVMRKVLRWLHDNPPSSAEPIVASPNAVDE
jgi:hypothetical protein